MDFEAINQWFAAHPDAILVTDKVNDPIQFAQKFVDKNRLIMELFSLMSIEEATQLILQAGAMGEGGEIFILKMGEPIKIAQMARDLIKLAGREPDTDIEIKFTGLREGEKLFEELITEGEGIVKTKHEKIVVLQGNGKRCTELHGVLEQLHQKAKEHDGPAIKKLLQQLIPEYTPADNPPIITTAMHQETTRLSSTEKL